MDTTDHTPNMIYEYLETMPEFPGGTMALYEFINTNLQYPEAAKKKKIEGNVYAKFVVTEDGSIINIAILRDIGGGCGEEVVRILSTMPKWKPGMQNGKPAAVFYKLPIKFTLSD